MVYTLYLYFLYNSNTKTNPILRHCVFDPGMMLEKHFHLEYVVRIIFAMMSLSRFSPVTLLYISASPDDVAVAAADGQD